MNQKIVRTIFLLSMLSLSSFITGMFIFQIIVPSLQINNDNSQEQLVNKAVDINQDSCCGHVDSNPPVISHKYPTNGSILLGGTTIEVDIIDDNPMDDFLPTEVLYHWDNDQSNTSIEDPPFEVVIPNEIGLHVLYIYAGDAANNWNSSVFYFTTTDDPNSVYIVPTSSIPTSDPPARRSSGFLLLPLLMALLGPSIILIWRRRKY